LPHSRSAKKRVRQNRSRRLKNRANKTFIKTKSKKLAGAVGEGNVETATTEYKTLVKALDRAARKGIIHPNMAARRKSRLLKRVSATGRQTPAEPKA
jgi:small subunit ribosomal protein S20